MNMAELKTDADLLGDILNGNKQTNQVLEQLTPTVSSGDGVPNSGTGGSDTSSTPHVCYLCGVSFSCRAYVNKHIKSVHAEISEHHNKCPKCPMTFQKYDTFWEHVVRVHENPGGQDLPLPQPGRKIDESEVPLVVPETEEEIEKLIESLVSSDNRTCLRCQKQLCDRRHVRRHIREVHLRLRLPGHTTVQCEHCNKTFVNNSVYQAHLRNIHLNPVPTMECPKCSGKMFKDLKGLRRHLREVHRLEEDEVNRLAPINPEKPKAVTVTPNSPNEQKVVPDEGQGEDVVYTCSTCEISFVTQDGLNRHNKNAHGMAVNMPRASSSSSNQSRHLRPVGGRKEYKCSKCGRCFSTRNGLRSHAVVHQKAPLERHMKNMLRTIFGQVLSNSSLTCGICQEVVSSSMEGRLHVYIKHPEKYEELVTRPAQQANGLLQCETCEERMESQVELIKHIENIHPEVYVPMCSQCGLKELKERDMNLHYKKYHPEISRYVCDVCKCGFMQKRELMYHHVREHRGDTVQCPYCEEKHVKVKLHVTVKHPERAEEYGKMRRKAIREEQVSRARFNKFLEKGVMEGKVGRGRYKKRKGKDDEEREEVDEDEDGDEEELEDRKPNICFVRETEKVVIPEQYKIKKNESTPHVIEVERLPPPPLPPPPEPCLEEEGTMGEEEEENGDGNEVDIKPDVNELDKCIDETREKTVALRLERLTEEEIGKWVKKGVEVEEATNETDVEDGDDDGKDDVGTLCKVTRKSGRSTSKRVRRRKRRRC